MKICLITFSNNGDHQNVVYSMYDALRAKGLDVYTVGIVNPKSQIAPHSERNFYYRCPERPGITKETFNLKVLNRIAKTVKKNKIDILYFESQHVWNAMLMLLCPQCKKVVAVHDVIPHDGNKAMDLSNFVTCHMANHIVLRNRKYYDLLSKRLRIPKEKISCIDLWRYWPRENNANRTGIFLCFGRIRRYKGFEYLHQIIQRIPNVQFKVVGDPDKESEDLVQQIKLCSNVEVVDREVSDQEMEQFFSKSDWIILPYSAATQSGVIVDAYKYSRPVISFDVGAISEQVKDGKTGYLIREKDVEGFCDSIIRACKMQQEEYETFCHEAYIFGKNKYSAEIASDEFIRVLHERALWK